MMRSSRLLPLSMGFVLLLGLGWFGYLRARGPALDRQLMITIGRRDVRKARELLNQGASPNARDARSGSALAWAVAYKNPAMCQLLLARGADAVNAKSVTGTPLFPAVVMLGDPEIVKIFLDSGADPRMATGMYFQGMPMRSNPRMRGSQLGETYTPLRMAAQLGHIAVLRLLLDAGAPVNEASPNHTTALMDAAVYDQDGAVKLLLSRGADTELPQSRETPLIRACRMGRWKAAKALIQGGADVNARDRSRWTPLHWAARKQDLATVSQLVARGAEIDARDGTGQTALMWAACYGNVGVAKWLIEHGADTSLQGPQRERALDIARRYRRGEVVKLLEAATGERQLARNPD